MKKIFEIVKTFLIFLIILFVIFFSVVNNEIIKINFDFFPFNSIIEMRLFLVVIFSFCFGFLVGLLSTSYSFLKKFFENIKNKRKVSKLEKQVKNMNNDGKNNE